MARGVADHDLIAPPAGQGVFHRGVRIKLRALLIERDDVELGSEPHGPRVGFELTGDQFDQRGLARSVRAGEPHTVAAQDLRGERRHDSPLAIGFSHVFGLDDEFAALTPVQHGRLRRPLGSHGLTPART